MCEMYPNGLPRGFSSGMFSKLETSKLQTMTIAKETSSQTQYKARRQAVHDYSRGRLTKPHDKLVVLTAVSKLASSYRGETDTFLAGLSRNDLPQALTWYYEYDMSNVQELLRPVKYREPSWPWVASDGPVSANSYLGDAIVEVLDVATSLAAANHSGAVDGGQITLSGLLLSAKPCESNLRVGVKVLTFDPAAACRTAGQLVWYPDDPTVTPEEVLCMVVRRRALYGAARKESSSRGCLWSFDGIVLTKSTINSTFHHRIGALK